MQSFLKLGQQIRNRGLLLLLLAVSKNVVTRVPSQSHFVQRRGPRIGCHKSQQNLSRRSTCQCYINTGATQHIIPSPTFYPASATCHVEWLFPEPRNLFVHFGSVAPAVYASLPNVNTLGRTSNPMNNSVAWRQAKQECFESHLFSLRKLWP